jgi:hypothetical protein
MAEDRPIENKVVQPGDTRGIGTEIVVGVVGVVGGIASGAAGAAVQQGLGKLGGGKNEPKK